MALSLWLPQVGQLPLPNSPVQIHVSHFTLGSLIHPLVALTFFSCNWVKNFYKQQYLATMQQPVALFPLLWTSSQACHHQPRDRALAICLGQQCLKLTGWPSFLQIGLIHLFLSETCWINIQFITYSSYSCFLSLMLSYNTTGPIRE